MKGCSFSRESFLSEPLASGADRLACVCVSLLSPYELPPHTPVSDDSPERGLHGYRLHVDMHSGARPASAAPFTISPPAKVKLPQFECLIRCEIQSLKRHGDHFLYPS